MDERAWREGRQIEGVTDTSSWQTAIATATASCDKPPSFCDSREKRPASHAPRRRLGTVEQAELFFCAGCKIQAAGATKKVEDDHGELWERR